MTQANVALANFVGGELSLLVAGRSDLPVFKRSVERAENFILLPQGPVMFRPGFRYVHHTRLNQKAVLISFQFNDQQAYQIEATNGYFRFYKDEAIITETPIAITGITNAAQGVITAASPLVNGNEVFLDGILGLVGLNGKSYLVSDVSGSTFKIKDVASGAYINTTTMGTYTSGGEVSRIYEIQTPYREQDLDAFADEDIATIQYSQNTDTMYIDHQNYEPRKLTRSGHANWALSRYTRTADPFEAAKNITAATAANPGVITVTAHGRAIGDKVFIDSVVGMTQLNNRHYIVNTVPTVNTLTLKNYDGTVVDTSAYTAYSSGGKLEWIEGNKYPRAVTFTADARVLHGGTPQKPESLFGSRAPTTADGVRYDDFTIGSLATDAVLFTLAPVDGQVNVVQWLSNTDKFIIAGTFGTIRRIYGATEQEAINPTSINAKSVNGYGGALASPVSLGSNLFYIQRGTQGLRSLEYDYATDGYLTTDRNLVSDHLPYPGLLQLTFQQGKPDILWATRVDGILLGLTYKDKEDISGWHRHLVGGTHVSDAGAVRPFGRILWASSMSRPTSQEQLWAVVEREIDGQTTRTVEFMTDAPVYPAFLDFFTGDKESDVTRFTNRLYEVQKMAVNLDCSLTYDGRDAGNSANATLTVAGTSVTSSASVFTAAMVGREIWGHYDENGEGSGIARITTYTSATAVTVEIIKAFTRTTLVPGDWFLTTDTLSGLDHLEGQTVGINLDGGPINDGVVTDGRISLEVQASVITVGLKYRGMVKSLNLDLGGASGSAQSKLRNVYKTNIRFLNSANARFGSNPYALQDIVFREVSNPVEQPIALYSGFQPVTYFDDTEDDKSVYIVQEVASPCTVTVLDVYTDTTDE